MLHAAVTLRIVHPVVTACRLWQNEHKPPTSTSFTSPIGVKSSSVRFSSQKNAEFMTVMQSAFSMFMFTVVSVLS